MKPVSEVSYVVAALVASRRQPRPPVGTRFGRLTTTKRLGYVKSGGHRRLMVFCECDCGQSRFIYAQYLRKAKSCGCQSIEKAKARKFPPGVAILDSPLYNTWANMRQRCSNERCKAWAYYGAKGVKVCAEWDSCFRAFESWALANGYRPGLTLDRINVFGDYEPQNCRFASALQQARNKRYHATLSAFGETKPVAEWAEDPRCRCNAKLLYFRRENGWDDAAVIVTPPHANPACMTAFGETKPLKEWAADHRCSVTYKVLWQRLHMNGMAPEEALTRNPRFRSQRIGGPPCPPDEPSGGHAHADTSLRGQRGYTPR